LTFISVTQADVIIQHDSGQWDGWEKFGANVEALWNENEMQVLSLGTMAFTSLIWILSILRVSERMLASSGVFLVAGVTDNLLRFSWPLSSTFSTCGTPSPATRTYRNTARTASTSEWERSCRRNTTKH
jgi:hypothetical protein